MMMFSSPTTTTTIKMNMMMTMMNNYSTLPNSSFIPSFPNPPSRLVHLRTNKNKKHFFSHAFSTKAAVSGGVAPAPAIALTEDALKHLNKMRSEKSEDLCLRIGVKQGGCSGMSYTMEFESKDNTRPDDTVMEYNGFVIVCDPKSLLFIFGMQLDFSDALIGGGFSFKNPNATQTCGCGKSFAS